VAVGAATTAAATASKASADLTVQLSDKLAPAATRFPEIIVA
jgi:hypothetical protein